MISPVSYKRKTVVGWWVGISNCFGQIWKNVNWRWSFLLLLWLSWSWLLHDYYDYNYDFILYFIFYILIQLTTKFRVSYSLKTSWIICISFCFLPSRIMINKRLDETIYHYYFPHFAQKKSKKRRRSLLICSPIIISNGKE